MARKWKASEFTGVDGPDGQKIPADLNNDGWVTQDEAKKAYENAWAGHEGQADPSAPSGSGDYAQLVQQHADVNGDGQIDHGEWSAYSASPQRDQDYRQFARGNSPGDVPEWMVQAMKALPFVGGPISYLMEDANRNNDAGGQGGRGGTGAQAGPTAEELMAHYGRLDPNERLLGQSAASQVYADPRDVDAQRRALAGLQRMGEGAYTAEETAGQRLLQGNAAQWEKQQRDAITQQAYERGQGGSGFEMMNLLGAQQGSANRAAEGQLELQRIAAARALQAQQAAMSGAGDMRGQGFKEGAFRGSATDELNKWNLDYQRGVDEFNQRSANLEEDSRVRAEQQVFENSIAGRGMSLEEWQARKAQGNIDRGRRDKEADAFKTSAARQGAGLYDYFFGDDSSSTASGDSSQPTGSSGSSLVSTPAYPSAPSSRVDDYYNPDDQESSTLAGRVSSGGRW